ncbi:hypothetical protein CL616_03760 [archaeon]|nr:hypothetical protein [archaeon]
MKKLVIIVLVVLLINSVYAYELQPTQLSSYALAIRGKGVGPAFQGIAQAQIKQMVITGISKEYPEFGEVYGWITAPQQQVINEIGKGNPEQAKQLSETMSFVQGGPLSYLEGKSIQQVCQQDKDACKNVQWGQFLYAATAKPIPKNHRVDNPNIIKKKFRAFSTTGNVIFKDVINDKTNRSRTIIKIDVPTTRIDNEPHDVLFTNEEAVFMIEKANFDNIRKSELWTPDEFLRLNEAENIIVNANTNTKEIYFISAGSFLKFDNINYNNLEEGSWLRFVNNRLIEADISPKQNTIYNINNVLIKLLVNSNLKFSNNKIFLRGNYSEVCFESCDFSRDSYRIYGDVVIDNKLIRKLRDDFKVKHKSKTFTLNNAIEILRDKFRLFGITDVEDRDKFRVKGNNIILLDKGSVQEDFIKVNDGVYEGKGDYELTVKESKFRIPGKYKLEIKNNQYRLTGDVNDRILIIDNDIYFVEDVLKKSYLLDRKLIGDSNLKIKDLDYTFNFREEDLNGFDTRVLRIKQGEKEIRFIKSNFDRSLKNLYKSIEKFRLKIDNT